MIRRATTGCQKLNLIISLLVGLMMTNAVCADKPNTLISPSYTVSPSNLTIAPNLSLGSDESVKGNTLTLTANNYKAIRNLSFNVGTSFDGHITVDTGQHCAPLKVGHKCTVTVKATVADNAPDQQSARLYIYNDSGAPTRKVDLTITKPQLQIADNAITPSNPNNQTATTQNTKSNVASKVSSAGDAKQTFTLANHSDVAARITEADLPPSSDHGVICTASDNCINASQSDPDTVCQSGDLIKPGKTCKLNVATISKEAKGLGELTVKGNLPDGQQQFPVNVAPVRLLFTKPQKSGGSGSGGKLKCKSSADQLLAHVQVPQAESDAGVACITNKSQFPLSGLIGIKVGPGGDSDDFTFDVQDAGNNTSFDSNDSQCSQTFIPANTTCKVLIKNNQADKGETGNLIVEGPNLLGKRQTLSFGLQGGLLVLPVNKQYISQLFKGQQLPGVTFTRIDVFNTSSNDINIDDMNITQGLTSDIELIPDDAPDTEHITNCDQDGMTLQPQQRCQVWLKKKPSAQPVIGYQQENNHDFRIDYSRAVNTSTQVTQAFRVDTPVFMRTYLVAGGDFKSVNNVANTGFLAKYGPDLMHYDSDDFVWSPLIPGIRGDKNSEQIIVNTIKLADNGNVYLGGLFRHTNVASVTKSGGSSDIGHVCGAQASSNNVGTACNIALFDGGLWHRLQQSKTEGVDGAVNTLEPGDEGRLYIGGEFDQAGIENGVNNVVLWQIRQGIANWYPLGPSRTTSLTGVNGPVHALSNLVTMNYFPNRTGWDVTAVPKLLVGGQFTRAGNQHSVNSSALWNNNQQIWNKKASGLKAIDGSDPTIVDLIDFDGTTYASGKFAITDTSSQSLVKIKDGDWFWPNTFSARFWHFKANNKAVAHINTLAQSTNSDGDNILWIGGDFTGVGLVGSKAFNIMRFNKKNAQWSSAARLEAPPNDMVNSIISQDMDGNLLTFVGGAFTSAASNSAINKLGYIKSEEKDGDIEYNWHQLSDLQPPSSDNKITMHFDNGDVHALAIMSMVNASPGGAPKLRT